MAHAYTAEKASDQYLEVNTCGEMLLDNRDYDTLREKGRVDVGIQYVAKGRAYYEDDGEIKEAPAGSVLLHFPHVRQHYFFKEEDKTQLLWVHFSGEGAALLQPLVSDKTVCLPIDDPHTFRNTLQKMIRVFTVREAEYKLICVGYLTVLLGLMLRSAQAPLPSRELSRNRLEPVLNHMNVFFYEPIDLARYADMCYVSRTRFVHLFKEQTGVSPYRFQLNIRIHRAKDLLENSSFSINECAQAVGFSDVSYFCRIFKKHTGYSPGEYRKG